MKIRTIEDLEKLYYSPAGIESITKADAPILTTTTGVYNPVYGAFAWAWLNQEANVFGALPKYPWTGRSGWRAITERATPSSGMGGISEGGTIPDSIKPTFVEISTKPKTVAHVFEVSEVQEFLAENGVDDAIGSIAQARTWMAIQHKEYINKMLMADVESQASGASGNYAGMDAMETLDRVVSSDSEEDAFGGTYSGWYDIYGLDRDTETVNDAVVLHNSGTDRVLTDDLIRQLLAQIRQASGSEPDVFITGHDTYAEIQKIYSTYVRYNEVGTAKVSVGVNGVKSAEGTPIGLNVPTLYGIPIITSKDTPVDGISRIFALNISDPEGFGVPRLGIMVAKPTQYFEARDPFVVEKFSIKGMYRTMGEIICRHFKSQGKLRDLKAS